MRGKREQSQANKHTWLNKMLTLTCECRHTHTHFHIRTPNQIICLHIFRIVRCSQMVTEIELGLCEERERDPLI